MTASALTKGRNGHIPVRLSHIPLELRQEVAHQLAGRWKLAGVDYAIFLLNASSPTGDKDVQLEVPADKYELVMAGKRPTGGLPKDLAIAPVSVL